MTDARMARALAVAVARVAAAAAACRHLEFELRLLRVVTAVDVVFPAILHAIGAAPRPASSGIACAREAIAADRIRAGVAARLAAVTAAIDNQRSISETKVGPLVRRDDHVDAIARFLTTCAATDSRAPEASPSLRCTL